MNKRSLNSRHLLVLLLIGIPCLLLVPLLKMAHERPHFVKTEDGNVSQILFAKDERSVCITIMCPNIIDTGAEDDCLDIRTSRPLSSFQKRQALLSSPCKYGPLSIRYNPNGDVFYNEKSRCPTPASPYAHIAYSADGQRLTLAGWTEIHVWDIKRGKRLSKTVFKQSKHDKWEKGIQSLSPDGTTCALTQFCKSQKKERYQLLNCQTGKIIAQVPTRNDVSEYDRSLSFFSSDSRTFVVCTSDQAKFFDARTAKLLWSSKLTCNNPIALVALYPTLNGLVGIPSERGFDLYDARTGNIARHFNHPTFSEIEAWNFSPDGKQLWWATPDNKIFWRDLS